MKYCIKCGNELDDKAVVCVKCGEPCRTKSNGKETGGGWLLILSILVPMAGFIVGCVMYNEDKKKTAKMCFAGAIIGIALETIFAIIIFLIPYVFLLL